MPSPRMKDYSVPPPPFPACAHALLGPFGAAGADAVSMAVVDAPADGRPSAPPPWSDGFVISVQLIDAVQRRSWEDDAVEAIHDLAAGDTVFHDLRRAPQILLDGPYSALNIHIPRTAFDRVAEQARAGPFIDLIYRVGAPVRDEVILHLAQALKPNLCSPTRGGGLFVEQLTLALAAHVAQAHGGLTAREDADCAQARTWLDRFGRLDN